MTRATVADLMPGDVATIGGDTFEVHGISPRGGGSWNIVTEERHCRWLVLHGATPCDVQPRRAGAPT